MKQSQSTCFNRSVITSPNRANKIPLCFFLDQDITNRDPTPKLLSNTLVTLSTCDLQAAPSFQQLHVVGGEHSIGAVGGEALPPACVDLVNVGDDVVRVKGNLCVISCNTKPKFPQTCISLNVSVVTVNLSIITLMKY